MSSSLPNTIGPINIVDNSLNGIIYELKNKYFIENPLSEHVIELSSTNTYMGNVETVVLWNYDTWQTFLKAPNEVFVQMKFPGRYLYPTGYSIRGVTDQTRHYATRWIIHGFNEGDEEGRDNWDILSENSTSKVSFCGSSESCNGKKNIASYTIKHTSKGYRYIRWTPTAISCPSSGNIAVTTSGMDIYGMLSKSSKLRIERQCTCKSRHVIAFSNSVFAMALLLCI